MSANTQHPSEMPSDILHSLGFRLGRSPHGPPDSECRYWFHQRAPGVFYYHILTPDQVAEALIEVGHAEFRRRILGVVADIDMREPESSD